MIHQVTSFKDGTGGLDSLLQSDPGPSAVNSFGVHFVIKSKGDYKMKKVAVYASNKNLGDENMVCLNQGSAMKLNQN